MRKESLSRVKTPKAKVPLPAPKFQGPIIGVRFIQLRDGRKIMQYSKMPGVWDTPETVDILSLPEDEQDEIRQAMSSTYDPNYR